ncbi:TonB-dependent receptor domain-containing protein [Spirosoma oryzicola]|uniref:TonB-dependent receptor domain-containing protein n=1 Tax=Spirosoma oryzicola TaxID=2898794 RepID=UPI001E376963|nr:TonB-dependent receptor [Spirosoma oryzicola]UHG92741.1 TonB-dependent receptor [Spirosoma oryzicola]
MKNLFFLVVLSLVATATIQAQTNILGRITDKKDEPVAGVSVVIRGTTTGTRSQANGVFKLPTTRDLPLTLTVSYEGYEDQSVVVRGNNFRSLSIRLIETAAKSNNVILSVSRRSEESRKAGLTVEKLDTRQVQQSPAASPFDALQNVPGVDLLTQSLTFKSVNVRGFGANNNTRFLQLTDGVDNRAPAFGFGLSNVASLPDLDVETIELVPGTSASLYGPDAFQGLLSTTSKNPFTHQGLSAQVKVGVNNIGKPGFGAKGYSDLAIRYAKQLGSRFAFKVNFQRLSGTDFMADDYSDRSTRARSNFFATDVSQGNLSTAIGYVPNNDPNTNLQYDGVNVYGDDINAGGAYRYPANYANASLQNVLVTRTGYSEQDVLGTNGKVFSNRANVALHYKISDQIEASVGWYYGNGSFTQTAGTRAYFPDYQRNQFKAELRGDNFFLRAYSTRQNAEGWNIGQTAVSVNNAWKPLTQWATEFGQVYVANKVSAGLARSEADRGRYLPGSASFDNARNAFANTFSTDTVPGYKGAKGTRFRDNSAFWHYEGMYDFTKMLDVVEVLVGGSIRRYALNTGGTLLARQADSAEYTINEYGAYIQVGKELKLGDALSIKPTVAVRYDKQQYFDGGFNPRASLVVSAGNHSFRASWQSAFRNPSPIEFLGVSAAGVGRQVGGSAIAIQSSGLLRDSVYRDNDVKEFTAGRITEAQLRSRGYKPATFTTEKVKTWEVGYKAFIANRLDIDAFYFYSQYTDFITAQSYYLPANNRVGSFTTNAYQALQINGNSPNELFVNGAGLSLAYSVGKGYTLSGNYTYQVGTVTLRDAQGTILRDNAGAEIVKRKTSSTEVIQQGRTYFNSPQNRYNISLANPQLTERLGATVTYRWTDRMWFEQGITAGDVWLPSWGSVDAQVSYRLPEYKSIVKLGGTNIFNDYYAQGYGLARIGGLYYVSVTFDQLFR